LTLIPSLRVLDGERFDPKFLNIKTKRAAFRELIETIDKRKAELEKKKMIKKLKKGELNSDEVAINEDEVGRFQRRKKVKDKVGEDVSKEDRVAIREERRHNTADGNSDQPAVKSSTSMIKTVFP
jgi:hypothetical protein